MANRRTAAGLVAGLRRAALRCPDTEEGIACKGTPVESSEFKAQKKTFLFLNEKQARLKLGPSLSRATRLASKEPGRYNVGAIGWVAVSFTDGEPPPLELLEKWVAESYREVTKPKVAKTKTG
jgi:hypothetical protein